MIKKIESEPINEDVQIPVNCMEMTLPFDEPFVARLSSGIDVAVRIMAVMMTLVILFGVLDIGWTICEILIAEPFMFLKIDNFLVIFGAFMAVLIAIEIFVNITIYLREDVIHVNMVMATALMATARKVITLDYKETPPEVIYGTAALVLAMSIGYWLIVFRGKNIALKLGDSNVHKTSQG